MKQKLKKKIKSLLYPSIYELVKYWYYRRIRGSFFAKDEIDKKLLQYINYRDGYFVELGANDGFTQSNTLYYELLKGWKGILIEPNPNQYLKCCYFRDYTKNEIFCNACVDFNYREKYVDMSYGDLMTTSESLELERPEGHNFFDKKNQHVNAIEHTLAFGSLASTLDGILKKSRAPKVIDLLSLDVEGAEFSVLSGIDYETNKFKYILVETRSPKKMKNFLIKRKYKFIENLSHHDMLFAYDHLS